MSNTDTTKKPGVNSSAHEWSEVLVSLKTSHEWSAVLVSLRTSVM